MDIVSVAAAEIGYRNKRSDKELYSKTSNILDDYNGYTKYGKEYGLNPAAWCAMFVWWVLEKCGIEYIKSAWVPDWEARAKSDGMWKTSDPKSGDIVIFGKSEHIGIVESVSDNLVVTIEGNADNGRVARNSYYKTSNYLRGYINMSYDVYKNGSTPEPVYSDSALTNKIGELNRYETCSKLGKIDGKTIVMYKVDGESYYKTGFVKFGGI